MSFDITKSGQPLIWGDDFHTVRRGVPGRRGMFQNICLSIYMYYSFERLLSCYVGPGKLSRYSDSLRAGQSGDRIPVGERFSAPVQTGPGAYPASCAMGAGSLPGVKRSGRCGDHPPHLSAEVKKE